MDAIHLGVLSVPFSSHLWATMGIERPILLPTGQPMALAARVQWKAIQIPVTIHYTRLMGEWPIPFLLHHSVGGAIDEWYPCRCYHSSKRLPLSPPGNRKLDNTAVTVTAHHQPWKEWKIYRVRVTLKTNPNNTLKKRFARGTRYPASGRIGMKLECSSKASD
ncbi:hypothetical protein HOY80DRAFT_1116103 [Tuber brumale]|nr:hypothetical protein HOY80DRAFT_1116103 [Tuber brumale]